MKKRNYDKPAMQPISIPTEDIMTLSGGEEVRNCDSIIANFENFFLSNEN